MTQTVLKNSVVMVTETGTATAVFLAKPSATEITALGTSLDRFEAGALNANIMPCKRLI